MKKPAAVFFFVVAISLSSFAQIPTTVTSITDPGTLIYRIQEAQNAAQTIENAIQQLQTADQALQYQIMSLQNLTHGSWQGFVNAWNDETVALNGYIAVVDNMPSLSQITAVADLVQSQGYKNAVSQLQTLQANWANASNVVHTTDNLVKNTANRQQLWSNIQANSSGNQSTLGQLETMNQALGLLGGEIQDLNTNMGSWKDYFVAQVEQQQMQQQIQKQEADGFIEGNSAANWVYSTGNIEQLESSHD
jgi:conjugal transfer/entry exclusion protein